MLENKQHTYTKLLQSSYLIKLINNSVNFLFFSFVSIILYALYLGIVVANTDSQQGEYYRIIYIHVPSAWMCILLYILLTFSSIFFIITKHPITSIISKSVSKIGTVFTVITLITGSLWGYPMWGAFWVWDARLTSVLILFFIYIAHLSILMNSDKNNKSERIGAIFAIIGFINIPIVKYSVEWWTTLHQESTITQFKTSIHNTMLLPLILVLIGFILISMYIISYDIKNIIFKRRIEALKIRE